jgi:ABC-2 type transport system ATP-binding protein
VDPFLNVRETVAMYAGYYPNPRPVDEVLAVVGLTEKRDELVRRLSGGQQRRLDVAVALAGDPELLFLDEPTTGFDPAARRQAWDTIRSLRELGKTVLLTTHYLEEAQALADRLAILRAGRIVATGSPQDLLAGHPMVEIRFRRNGHEVVIDTDEPTRVLHQLTADALAHGVELEGLEVQRRTLEDVYLEITREES